MFWLRYSKHPALAERTQLSAATGEWKGRSAPTVRFGGEDRHNTGRPAACSQTVKPKERTPVPATGVFVFW